METVVPSETDWAVVAKVNKLTPDQANEAGRSIAKLLQSKYDGLGARFLGVEGSRSDLATFTYSFLADPESNESSARSIAEHAIDLTQDGLGSADFLNSNILAVRLAHWGHLIVRNEEGERAYEPTWDKLTGLPDYTIDEMLEARGHGISGAR